jgi:peptide/nickel transport system substrate-binding protein
MLAGCTPPQSQVVEGSSLAVAWNQSFTSYNSLTSFGTSTANNNITYATLDNFFYYDDTPALVKNDSFGSYEMLSRDPLVVKYTIADGVRWSDGTAVDAADLLLQWAALSGAENTPDFDPTRFMDKKTNEFIQKLPKNAVYFDAGSDPDVGLGLVTRVPQISADKKSITMAYDKPFVDWETAMSSLLPAHVVAKNALGLKDNEEAKDALTKAITEHDVSALSKISNFWNSGFNFSRMPSNPELLLSDGPYVITDIVQDEYVTLTANKEYTGRNQPAVETITVRFIADPLEAVQALENNEVQLIAPQASADVVNALATLDVKTISGYGESYEHVDLQFDKSKSNLFQDPRVREAFLKVIPRNQIVDTLIAPIGKGAVVRNSQVFFPGQEGYGESAKANGSKAYSKVDIEGAAALLEKAGVVAPEVCMLFDSTNPRRIAEFSMIQKSAAGAGFVVTDCSSPHWSDLLGTPGAYDAALFGWKSTTLRVSNGAPATFNSAGVNNHNFYKDSKMDALTDELSAEFDHDHQVAIEKRIDKVLWDDFYGLTIYQFPTVTAYDESRIANISPSTLAPTIFWNIWDWEPVTNGG